MRAYLTESIYEVVLQKWIPPQIRQRILHDYRNKELVDGFVRELTFAKRLCKHFLRDRNASNGKLRLAEAAVGHTGKSAEGRRGADWTSLERVRARARERESESARERESERARATERERESESERERSRERERVQRAPTTPVR